LEAAIVKQRVIQGFTLTEMMVVVAIIGIASAVTMPIFDDVQDNQELKAISRDFGSSLTLARQLAIQTGNNHILYLATTAATDICGNPLQDAAGNFVPLLILDDGPPSGANNCCIDAGETTITRSAAAGVSWGVTFAGAKNPADLGGGVFTTGSTFTNPAGAQARWVLFRPDGVPVGFSTACAEGQLGSGAGAIYMTNANRDYAAILSPLGAVKVRGFDQTGNAWSN
jgi:prepilin-type N-terminal cleavage/methylation domain-containing protein